MTTLTAINHIMLALERRFPKHNGPFEYATRLCEESGELVEALVAPTGTHSEAHVLKELEDVARVALGIAHVYDIENRFLGDLKEYVPADDISNNTPVLLCIAAGELARAVNYAEGMGVKAEKHTQNVHQLLEQRIRDMLQIVAGELHRLDAFEAFDTQIAELYRDYQRQGFIPDLE